MTQETARPKPRPAPPAFGEGAISTQRRHDMRADRRSKTRRAKPRARRSAAPVARAFAALLRVMFGAALVWVAAIGADSAMAPGLPALSLTAPAAAAATVAMTVWAVDVTGDGVADLANPTNGALRAVDLYGSGSFGAARSTGKHRRIHQGADYISFPGQLVRAPISGEVTKIGFAYSNDQTLRFVEIKNAASGETARVLYVKPIVRKGQVIAATDPIGGAQNLAFRYPGITNHVHVELMDARGRHENPEMLLPNTPQFTRMATAAQPSAG